MSLSSEKLYKIFKLESEFDYENKAVVGGLQRLAESWVNEARAEGMSESLIPAISSILTHYPNLNIEERWGALQEIGDLLEIRTISNLPKPDQAKTNPQKSSTREYVQSYKSKQIENPETAGKTSEIAEQVIHTKVNKRTQEISRNPIADSNVGLTAPISVIRGVGIKQAEHLHKLGLHSIEDMLYFFPRRYDDYSQLRTINQLQYGQEVSIVACVQSINTFQTKRSRKITEAVVSDATGSIRLLWFNADFHMRYLKKGMYLSISGKTDYYLGRSVIYHPDYEPIDQQQLHTNRIVPVYPLTALITQRWLRRTMYNTISFWSPRLQDFLPAEILEKTDLPDLQTAIKQVHFPESQDNLESARHRLAFDELFLLQLGVIRQKSQWHALEGVRYTVPDEWFDNQIRKLPYSMTNAQIQAVTDIRKDLGSGHPMNRLLQGDVGSGKTVIAGLGMAIVIQNGAQAALMAPTGILAEQHYQSMIKQFCNSDDNPEILEPTQVRLLTGDTSTSDRQEISEGLCNGWIKLLIGTHALIEDPVKFQNLQMVVVDEQHRFGVKQRAALRMKGNNPHLLVMTATPIPRSLQLTIFGDLDVSVMDEMPAGRLPIETQLFYPMERERAYSLIRSQVLSGFQAFIIYPLVEQGDNEEAKAAVEEQQRLQEEIFPDLRVGLMHGRMKPDEKDSIMKAFKTKEYDILVSTSVVEVGIDIPNATVMLIEGANRFGLAQLHQFRGRVGRGRVQSYCILIPETEDAIENDRLLVMTKTNDGFELAEQDLLQRGPGDFLGTRQAGFADLKMANLSNIRLIEQARHFATETFEKDPELETEQHKLLRQALDHFWPVAEGVGDMS